LFNANSAIVQLYHGENRFVMSGWCPLCTRPTRWVGYLLLAHWNNSLWVNMSLQSDTLFWFRANQSLLLLPSAACFIAERQQIPIL